MKHMNYIYKINIISLIDHYNISFTFLTSSFSKYHFIDEIKLLFVYGCFLVGRGRTLTASSTSEEECSPAKR